MDGREKSNSSPDLIIESANLLEKAYQLNRDFSQARATRNWVEGKYSQLVNTRARVSTASTNDTLPNAETPDVTRWCKDNGFDVHSRDFSFDIPNADGKTPLHVAVVDHGLEVEILKKIMDCVETLETRDSNGCTPLLLACGTRNWKKTKVLLDRGAKLDVQDKYHDTPLHKVQEKTGGTTAATLLLSHRSHAIDIDAKNCHNKTALYLACEMENEAMVRLLIKYKADIDCRGPHGYTPLHVAIDYRRLFIVKILLSNNADPTICDADGRDALRVAKTTRQGSQEIQKLLRDHEIKLGRKRKQS